MWVADVVVCVSEALGRSILGRLPEPPCSVTVVHGGVDRLTFTPGGRSVRQSGWPLRLLFVGAVAPHNGPGLLLRAVAEAQQQGAGPFEVEILGGAHYGPSAPLTEYEQQLRVIAHQLGLEAHFTAFVARHQLPSLCRAVDLLAVPSVSEDPFALVILEAMACGWPVLTSGRGGTKEAGGDVAWYVGLEDAAAFADILGELAAAPDQLKDRSIAGLARAAAFTRHDATTSLLDVAGEVEGAGPRPAAIGSQALRPGPPLLRLRRGGDHGRGDCGPV